MEVRAPRSKAKLELTKEEEKGGAAAASDEVRGAVVAKVLKARGQVHDARVRKKNRTMTKAQEEAENDPLKWACPRVTTTTRRL